jgi:hypothetical protein|tara:strand:- start:11 stop:199 length:189 start_codon:yes stop_codon:yes gene_type:complete
MRTPRKWHTASFFSASTYHHREKPIVVVIVVSLFISLTNHTISLDTTRPTTARPPPFRDARG